MERFVDWVIRRRWVVLAVCLGICLLSLASVSQGVLATSIGKMLLGESERYDAYMEASQRFGGDQAIVIGIDDPDALTEAGRARLREVSQRLAAVPEVDRVETILDASKLVPGPMGLPQPVPLVQGIETDEQARDALARLARHERYGGLLVGRDGRSCAVFVHMKVQDDVAAETLPGLLERVRASFAGTYPPEAVHAVGLPVLTAEMLEQTVAALVLTTPLVGLVLLLTVWLLFRRIWPAALSLLVAGVGVLWTMGIAVALEPQVNMLTGAVPAIMLIIAFSDVVHLCSAYLLELDELKDKDAAIRAACSEVGRACLFTSITTGTGFLCLSLIPTPAFRVLGVVLGCGVGLALLLAVTLTPILFHMLPAPRPLRRGATAGAQAAIDRWLQRMQALSTGRPRSVVAAFAIVAVLAGAAALQLEIETDFSKRIAADNPVRQDQAWFEARFVGANMVQVYLDAPGALDDPEWFRRVAAFQDRVANLPDVERAASLVDVMREIHRATPAGVTGDLPQAEPLRLQLRLVLGSGQPALRTLVDPERKRLRLIANARGQGMRTTGRVATQIEALAAESPGLGQVVATGLNPLLGQWLDQVVRAQRDGMFTSAAIIAIVMVIGLRSLRVGLGSMPPNLFPLLIVVACLSLFWDQVDSDSIALTFVALGIGVDDTIHFLTRLRLESARHPDPAVAIERTFAFAGRAIVMTTVILAAGFAPFLVSDYFLMRMFGTMLPLCMIVALLADLLLVPAMAQLGWLRFASAQPAADAAEPPAAPADPS